jgi:hypothetical protein
MFRPTSWCHHQVNINESKNVCKQTTGMPLAYQLFTYVVLFNIYIYIYICKVMHAHYRP